MCMCVIMQSSLGILKKKNTYSCSLVHTIISCWGWTRAMHCLIIPYTEVMLSVIKWPRSSTIVNLVPATTVTSVSYLTTSFVELFTARYDSWRAIAKFSSKSRLWDRIRKGSTIILVGHAGSKPLLQLCIIIIIYFQKHHSKNSNTLCVVSSGGQKGWISVVSTSLLKLMKIHMYIMQCSSP